jgi:hypothetical protein
VISFGNLIRSPKFLWASEEVAAGMLELSQEEVSHTISRASQIVENQAEGSQIRLGGYEAYVCAAEEMGIPRDAMLQALRERNLLPVDAFNPGDEVFAPSADNASYAATIIRVVSDASVVVKFLNGGEHTVSHMDIRPLSMVPGRQLQFQHKDMGEGIWYTGKLLEYDTVKRVARISYAAVPYTVPITRVRLKAPKVQKVQVPATVRQLLFCTVLVSGSIAGGIGFLLGYLLHAH